jgi:hypothetical protein
MKAPSAESLSRDGGGAIAARGTSRSCAPPRSRGKDAAPLSPDGCRAARKPSQRLAEGGRETIPADRSALAGRRGAIPYVEMCG